MRWSSLEESFCPASLFVSLLPGEELYAESV